jgi:hypothetical protein
MADVSVEFDAIKFGESKRERQDVYGGFDTYPSATGTFIVRRANFGALEINVTVGVENGADTVAQDLRAAFHEFSLSLAEQTKDWAPKP